jgi:hypothetical protein
MSAVGKTSAPLEAGRSALERHAWAEALAQLKQADAEKPLDAAGLEMLADAATPTSFFRPSSSRRSAMTRGRT